MDAGKKNEAPAPPPTYSGISPIPQPLPPRKQRKSDKVESDDEDDTTPLFQRRGDVANDERLRAAYRDVSEDDSDDELPENKLSQWVLIVKRKMRKGVAFVSYQAQKAGNEAKLYAHEAFLTDRHLERRFHEGATLTELVIEGFSLKRCIRVLGVKTLDQIISLDIQPPFKPELWDILINEPYNLHWSDLEKFDLHNLEEYVQAGLSADQLHRIGTDLNVLLAEGRFTRECMVAVAKAPFYWNLDNYHVFGIDYNVFHRLQLQEDDYPSLLGCQGWQLAEYLGLYNSSTQSTSPEARVQLCAININV
ncbi:MAG: hypothetical protein CMP20_02605 [Rickettsiales bacterium]|nr:hypothetical protein [Rickettsiales bacterium]